MAKIKVLRAKGYLAVGAAGGSGRTVEPGDVVLVGEAPGVLDDDGNLYPEYEDNYELDELDQAEAHQQVKAAGGRIYQPTAADLPRSRGFSARGGDVTHSTSGPSGEVVPAGEVESGVPAENLPPGDEADPKTTLPNFDPTTASVADVMKYLESAPPDEVARVQQLEAKNTGRQGGPSARIAKFGKDA